MWPFVFLGLALAAVSRRNRSTPMTAVEAQAERTRIGAALDAFHEAVRHAQFDPRTAAQVWAQGQLLGRYYEIRSASTAAVMSIGPAIDDLTRGASFPSTQRAWRINGEEIDPLPYVPTPTDVWHDPSLLPQAMGAGLNEHLEWAIRTAAANAQQIEDIYRKALGP
jgi:hypothetical protein